MRKFFETIWDAISYPFVSLAILWEESPNLIFGDEKEGD